MIQLTLLDHHAIVLNCDLIAWMTAQPDTTVRMVTGESLVVREPVDEVMKRIVEFRAKILSAAGLDAAFAPGSGQRSSVALGTLFAGADRDDEAEARSE
jgi:flagellar protein FlbD